MNADSVRVFHSHGFVSEQGRTGDGAEMVTVIQQGQGGSRIDALEDQRIPVRSLSVEGEDAAKAAGQSHIGRGTGDKGHAGAAHKTEDRYGKAFHQGPDFRFPRDIQSGT